MSSMYFAPYLTADEIAGLIKPKIKALLAGNNRGIVVDIKKQVRTRTQRQNKYLWAIYKNIIEFNDHAGLGKDNGGYLPDHLMLNFINSDFLHEYFKARFDIKESKKLSTAEFSEYCDKIQLLMTEQSDGEYDAIFPDEPLDIGD